MNSARRYPLRKIAESVLVKHFGELDAESRNALATSLVRQWLTNDGHAGFITTTHQHWFQLVTRDDGLEVGYGNSEGNWGRLLSNDWNVDDDKIPDLLHQLNLCQSARCRNADGRIIGLRIEPKERTVKCQEQAEEEGDTVL